MTDVFFLHATHYITLTISDGRILPFRDMTDTIFNQILQYDTIQKGLVTYHGPHNRNHLAMLAVVGKAAHEQLNISTPDSPGAAT